MEDQYCLAQRISCREKEFSMYQTKRFGKRYVEYRRAYETAADLSNIPSFPLYITIETSHKCNLNCISCVAHGPRYKDVKSELDSKSTIGIMDMSVLDTILDQAKEYCLSSIGLNWLGEPTLAKDLELRIQKCVNAGIMDVLMSTNGMLIDELLSKQIIQAGLTHMLFSIDAASEETYELIRLNGDFKRVNRNIETFIKVRNQITGNVHPLTRASLVPSKLNQKEIGKFVEKYSKIVDYVEIQPFFNNFFRLNDLVADKAKKVSFKCKEVFTKLNIDSNGDVHPCCSIYGRDIILGNIKNDDLKDIFTTNPILVMLRKEISKNIYSLEQCKLCQQSMYRLNINDSHTKNSTELPVLS